MEKYMYKKYIKKYCKFVGYFVGLSLLQVLTLVPGVSRVSSSGGCNKKIDVN